jgi:hypothetical protein
MLRTVVSCSRAIEVTVSPLRTRYARKVGWGVAVGRLNVRLGEGVAGVGTGGWVTGAADTAAGGCVRRLAGCGTHAAAMTTSSPTSAEAASERTTAPLLMRVRTVGRGRP